MQGFCKVSTFLLLAPNRLILATYNSSNENTNPILFDFFNAVKHLTSNIMRLMISDHASIKRFHHFNNSYIKKPLTAAVGFGIPVSLIISRKSISIPVAIDVIGTSL